ncbi:MAG: endonuclease/exonuclease/phosphatase family protein [Desulfobacula sp.]
MTVINYPSQKWIWFLSFFLKLGVYVYGAGVVIIWWILHYWGDEWWFATILLYGPHWIYLLPLIFLLPMAILWARRLLLPLIAITILIVWQIMGFTVSLPRKDNPGASKLRVVTYNVQRWEVSGQEFSNLLETIRPDILAVQECASPRSLKIPPPWHVKASMNSIVVSRFPIIESTVIKRGYDTSGLYCIIETPKGPVGFCCVDLLTPRRALTHVLDRNKIFNLGSVDIADQGIENRWTESEKLFKWLKGVGDEKIIAGDFNLTVDSNIYRKYWSNYQNAFNQIGFGFGYTKKTTINIFRYRSRIDHILSTPQFRPVRTWMGPDFGADHLPLVVEFEY